MATLAETIARRKRMRMASQTLPPEALIGLRDLADLIDELKQARVQVEETITAAKAIAKGDKGDPAPAIDLDLLAHKVALLMPRPADGVDGDAGADADEDAIQTRLYTKLLKALPPPEKGDPGEPGKAATIDHVELADTLLEKLKNDKSLKIEHIGGIKEQMDKYWQQVHKRFNSGVFSGGGDSVTAGTNVTITNVNGRKVISAAGGSGFTALAATETPNGSLTVFTFAGASAQPSYLRVDNVWVKAVSASGTVNWTWNNGTKKATLAVAPQDDIEGIV